MHRGTVIAGGLLAVAAGLLCVIGESLGLDMQHVALLGGAIGGVIGLVPDRSPAARVTGFVIGFAVAWLGFAIRALYLPDSASGRGVAAVLVVVACAGVAVGTGTRVPLWSLLLGSAAMVGGYEETYTADSPAFLADSPVAATTVLLAAGIGFLATSILGPQTAAPGERPEPDDQPVPPPDPPDRVPAGQHRADDFLTTDFGDRP